MNRRDILAVLGIGATGLAGTESMTTRAASLDVGHMNYDKDKYPNVPQFDQNGPARQRAIADALASLAHELRLSATAAEVRNNIYEREKQLAAEARARGDEKPVARLPRPDHVDEVWAISLQTKSKMGGGEWLQHRIVVDVELHHAT